MNDLEENERAMEEAYNMTSTGHCRYLFAMILIRCTPTNPRAFYDKHKRNLASNIIKRQRRLINTNARFTHAIENTLLRYLDRIMERNGCSPTDYGITLESDKHPRANIFVSNMKFENTQNLDRQYGFNEKQQEVYDAAIDSTVGGQGRAFFVDAPGGTRKTYVQKCIIETLVSAGYKVIATASSGVASTLLPDGQTIHSAFKVLLKSTRSMYCNIEKQSNLARAIREAHLLIWDEAPMMTRYVMECLDR
ncbi:MAG: hypothetical protein MHMPM18_005222 [Marteilia pararefringens]